MLGEACLEDPQHVAAVVAEPGRIVERALRVETEPHGTAEPTRRGPGRQRAGGSRGYDARVDAPRRSDLLRLRPGLEAVLAAELSGLGLDARSLAGAPRRAARTRPRSRASRRGPQTRCCSGCGRAIPRSLGRETRRARRAATRRSSSGPGAGARRSPSTPLGHRCSAAAGAPASAPRRCGRRSPPGSSSCGWRGDRPFLDPMCGSGTIAIEAALVAARRAPGLGRSFAFEGFRPRRRPDRAAPRAPRGARATRLRPGARVRSKRGALRLAQKNAAAAGVADAIRFVREDAAAAEPPAGQGCAR